MADVFAFVTSLVSGISLTSFSVYYVVCLADIMFDFVTVEKGCEKMNRIVILEVVLISYIPLLMFYCSHWILSLLIVPLTIHTFYKYVTNTGMVKYDAKRIREENAIVKCYLSEAFIKILLHLLMSLVILYFCIISVLEELV